MRSIVRVACVCLASLLPAVSAHAQTAALADDARKGLVSAGAYFGIEFENPDHQLLVGGDARVRLGTMNLEINPRYSFRPFDDGSMQQIDVNVVTNYLLSNPGRFRPYSGIGLGLNHYSFEQFDGQTNVGLNLVTGVRLAMRAGAAYEPFLQAQYTIMKEPANSFTLVLGTSFSFR